MTSEAGTSAPGLAKADRRLAILLAAAMFVLVVDTSVMNVSISAVVHDLHTTVSGVQSAIALEALVSAAFILIGSKVGDLIGRKRAYVLGLLGYAIGALAMALAQGLTAVIVFWAIVGGIGASLLLPAMQSLIHGNFDGAARKKAYALVGKAVPPQQIECLTHEGWVPVSTMTEIASVFARKDFEVQLRAGLLKFFSENNALMEKQGAIYELEEALAEELKKSKFLQ